MLQAGSDVDEAVLVDPGALDEYDLTEKARAVIARALELDRERRARRNGSGVIFRDTCLGVAAT